MDGKDSFIVLLFSMKGAREMFDIAIIGAGVTGCAAARELSKYRGNICVIEKEEDVCCGTSKANSAIIHAGFDAVPGTLKAKLNVRGNEMMDLLSDELDIPLKRIGSLVVRRKEDDGAGLEELYTRGQKNKVPGLRIIRGEELRKTEPELSDEVVEALYAPTGAIVCPFEMTIALAENAVENGVTFYFDREVTDIQKEEEGYVIHTADEEFRAKCIVNAAGVYADKIHNMVCKNKLCIIPRKGEYLLMDKTAGNHVKHTVFQLPGKMGKGVLVTPTIHGNLLVGPTAVNIDEKDGSNTTAEGLEEIRIKAEKSVKDLPFRQVITSFAGIRAHEKGNDFVIGEAEDAPFFYDAAGIESPGLTSAPAIGEMLADMIKDRMELRKKDHFISRRKGMIRPDTLTVEERNQLIAEKPEYGTIICRCEMISEGEIVEAIHRPIGARSLDGIKRRTRAGMGRCQAGFCTPKTIEILQRETGMAMEEVTKSGGNSNMILGKNKEI